MSVSPIARKYQRTPGELCILELDDNVLPYARAITSPGRSERDPKQLEIDRLCLEVYRQWVDEGREDEWLKCPLRFLVATDASDAENLRYRIRRSIKLMDRKDHQYQARFGKYKAFVDDNLLSVLPDDGSCCVKSSERDDCGKLQLDEVIVAFTITDKMD